MLGIVITLYIVSDASINQARINKIWLAVTADEITEITNNYVAWSQPYLYGITASNKKCTQHLFNHFQIGGNHFQFIDFWLVW